MYPCKIVNIFFSFKVSSNGVPSAAHNGAIENHANPIQAEDGDSIESHKKFEQARKSHYNMKAAMANKFDSEEDEEEDI